MAGRPKAQRPYRIFDEVKKMDVPHRAYLTEQRAVERSLVLLYWLKVGDSYTVYDSRSGRAIMQFTRKVNAIYIWKE